MGESARTTAFGRGWRTDGVLHTRHPSFVNAGVLPRMYNQKGFAGPYTVQRASE
jgi:hypothetical protein